MATLTAAMCNHADCMPALMAAEHQCKPVFEEQEAIGIPSLMMSVLFGSTEVGQVLHTSPATLHVSYCLQSLKP